VRAVAFQSMARCASPWRYSRSWWNSMPSPRFRTCSTPICDRRLSVASSVYFASARKLGYTLIWLCAPILRLTCHRPSGEKSLASAAWNSPSPRATGRTW